MGIIEERQTDHLLLLVGTNPLPNLVAARLLLKKEGTAHLICTQSTQQIAKRLKENLIQVEGYKALIPSSIQEANANSIERDIKKYVSGLNGSVGLNYTGGTKAMAVHAYRAVEEELSSKGIQPVFSYLDANTFEMRFDPEYHTPVLLREEVKLSLEELTTLHGCQLKSNSPKREEHLKLQRTAHALAQAATIDHGLPTWRTWCDQSLRDNTHDDIGRMKKKASLRNLILDLPKDESLSNSMAVLKEELGLNDHKLPLNPQELNWPFGKGEPKYLVEWLDGIWLEHYVFSQIMEIADECNIHDIGMSLDTDEKIESAFNFEFDVAAMKGYQFFGLSCTTNNDLSGPSKSLTKSKFFEAYIRARQLGGDEARVGLILTYHNPQRLQKELVQSWDAEGKIRVFGINELPNLSEHLKDWFIEGSK